MNAMRDDWALGLLQDMGFATVEDAEKFIAQRATSTCSSCGRDLTMLSKTIDLDTGLKTCS